MGLENDPNVPAGNAPNIAVASIADELELLRQAIRGDKDALDAIGTPIGEMRYQAEKASAAFKASDLALQALEVLQRNSVEISRASDIATLALKSSIEINEKDADQKERVLDSLKKIIDKNRKSIAASAIALRALNEMAFNDSLTGLPNRRLLADRLKQMIATNKRWNSYSAAIFIDLDKFKLVNDEFGHEAGDELLIAFGNRLKLGVRVTDTVARYGGDEFVILLSKLNGNLVDARAQVEIISNKLLDSLIAPYDLTVHVEGARKHIVHHVNASLGIAMFNGDFTEEPKIVDWADEAMYLAKSEGGKRIRFYDAKNSVENTLTALYNLATLNGIESTNHGIRTRQYVKTLARRAQQMNLFPGEIDNEFVERIFKATQLHDIGKSKIPDAIVHKLGKLSPEERMAMRAHTTLGAEMMGDAKNLYTSLSDFLSTAIEVAESHHEHWDGSGYPKGLVGKSIPLPGRIMAIADVYDALISRRSYKEPWRHEDTVAEIVSKAGTQFDPLLIEAFIREQENFRLIAENAPD